MRWLERLLKKREPGGLSTDTVPVEGEPPIKPSSPPSLHVNGALDNPLLLPPLTLAYVGDAVFELYVRTRLLERGKVRVSDLHRGAVNYVRASAQARTLAEMSPSLTETERGIVRRGRNAKSHAAPKGSDPAEYAASTAFETLLGYLYLAGMEERLGQLLVQAARRVEQAAD